jgi:hypothetical protein
MHMPYIFHFTYIKFVLESLASRRVGQVLTPILAPIFKGGTMAPGERWTSLWVPGSWD